MASILKRFNEGRSDDDAITERKPILEEYDAHNPFELGWDKRDYDKQFFHMYKTRLLELRKRIEIECYKKWNSEFELNGKKVVKKDRVLDIKANEPCWCIGTIYCELQYKPNILQEIVEDTYGAPDLVKSYIDLSENGKNELMLEDESGRVLLVGDMIFNQPFITGTVMGVLGMEAEPGTFQILDVCYPTPLPQQIRLSNDNGNADNNDKIALLSGLNIDTKTPKNILRLKLLQEYLQGNLSQDSLVKNVNKLIICGNSIDGNKSTAASNGSESQLELVQNLNELSNFLINIIPSISVNLMPGPSDPSDKALPQQPFNKALFKQSLRPYLNNVNQSLLNLATNPNIFNINNCKILAVAGQSIDDICKYIIPKDYVNGKNGNDSEDSNDAMDLDKENDQVDIKDTTEHRLDLIEYCVRWQNIVPSAPDTICSYPFNKQDPFILNEWPHVYIVGNQPHFGERDVKIKIKSGEEDGTITEGNIKLITSPQFSETGEIVILDTKTMTTEIVRIDI